MGRRRWRTSGLVAALTTRAGGLWERVTGSRPVYLQAAAVPYRRRAGTVSVLLITSLGSRHWIVPKGIIERGQTPLQAAAAEAYEEAGVQGTVLDPPLGSYSYEKWGGTCDVTVYAMQVTSVLAIWPEASDRERQWVTLEQAARLVDRAELKDIVESLGAWLERHDPV